MTASNTVRTSLTLESAREIMTATIKEASLCAAQQDRLNKRKAGVYDTLTAIAAQMTMADFIKVTDSLQADIVVNLNNLAVDLKCKRTKKGDKFAVPSAWSAAMFYQKAAYDMGVPMADRDGPRPFSQVRSDVIEAKAILEASSQSDEDRLRNTVAAQLRALAELIESGDAAMSLVVSAGVAIDKLGTRADKATEKKAA